MSVFLMLWQLTTPAYLCFLIILSRYSCKVCLNTNQELKIANAVIFILKDLFYKDKKHQFDTLKYACSFGVKTSYLISDNLFSLDM